MAVYLDGLHSGGSLCLSRGRVKRLGRTFVVDDLLVADLDESSEALASRYLAAAVTFVALLWLWSYGTALVE